MQKHQLHPETWVDLYGDMLLNYALIRVKERDMARDLVQDTFVTALKSVKTFRGEVSEKNWLYLVLKTRILDYYKKKKEVLASDLKKEDEEDDYFMDGGHWVKDKMPNEWTTEKMVQSEEFMSVLTDCTDRLTQSQSMVFYMKYIDGEDSDTICMELEISPSNYWVIVHRAKLQLRNCLEKTWMS
jgi:RNA polymerase sigma-70 factor (TIGR02943 family)